MSESGAWRARDERLGVVRVGPGDPGRGVLAVDRRDLTPTVLWDPYTGARPGPCPSDVDILALAWFSDRAVTFVREALTELGPSPHG